MTGQPQEPPASDLRESSSSRSRRIFVSYAHENAQHKGNVLALAEIVGAHGCDVFLDRWNKVPRLDWNQTVTNEIRDADFVLAVVSSSYKAAAEGESPAGKNLGVQHELAIIRELLNSNRAEWLPKIIPVILPGWTIDDVPLVLQPTTANRCEIDDVTDADPGVEDLLELLAAEPSSSRRSGVKGATRQRRWRSRTGARTATAKRVLLNRWTLIVSALAASGSILAVAVACGQDTGNPGQGVTVSGTGNSVNQNSGTCGQVSNNSTCVVQLQNAVDQAGEAASSDADFKAKLAKDATDNPANFGSGPWPFVVVDTVNNNGQDLGLFARTTNQANAERLGTAANRTMIWADCIARSDFTPQDVTGDNNVGPQWLRVRWKPTGPTDRSVSEPTETQRAWMYRGATVPIQHGGNIPPCS